MKTDKITSYLCLTLVLVSTVMFIWTVNYINASDSTQVPTAITAFNA